MSNREYLVDAGYDESIVFENPDYDEAIVGVTTDDAVVYDYYKMVEHLMTVEGMTEMEAVDFIDYNTLRVRPYIENPPIILISLEFM